MPIKVTCRCGSRFSARDELQGQKVKCPSCQAALIVPRASEPAAEDVVAQCPACAARFKAPSRLLGKSTACPTCKQPFVVRKSQAAKAAPPTPSLDDALWDEVEARPSRPASQATRHEPQSHYALSEGRPYVHSACGQVTQVTGGDFRGLCNPLYRCRGTYCAACGSPDRLGSFTWVDTGETLSAYRRRLKENAPPWMRYWRYAAGVVGLILGAAIGPMFVENHHLFVAVVSAIGGGFVAVEGLGPFMLSMLPGYQFYQHR